MAAVAFVLAVVVGGLGGDDRGASLDARTAAAGQCVDVAEDAGRIDITEADCTRAHDAEIVHTAQVGDAMAERGGLDLDDAQAICSGLMDDADVARLGDHDGDLTWGLLIDEPDNIDTYDRLVCYVRATDGRLDEPLLG